MDITTFKTNLETLGADLARWPPHEAQAALDLMDGSDAAKDLFAQATADDVALFGDDAAAVDRLGQAIVKKA